MTSIKLYDNIILLESNGSAKLIGDFEIFTEADADNKEADGNTEEKNNAVFKSISEVIKYFNADKDTVADLNTRMTNNADKLKKGGIKNLLLFFVTKLGFGIAKVYHAIDKAVKFIWEQIKKIPGVNTVTNFVSQQLAKIGGDKPFKLFKTDLTVADVTKFISVTFVLVGSLGYIMKRLKAAYDNNSNSVNVESTQIQIHTTPLILTESNMPSESFIKKGTSALANILNFGKNVRDAAIRAFIGAIGTMLAAGFMVLILLISRKPVQAAIEFAVNNKGKDLTGIDKAKYVGSKVVEAMAKFATFNGAFNSDVFVDESRYHADYKTKSFTVKN